MGIRTRRIIAVAIFMIASIGVALAGLGVGMGGTAWAGHMQGPACHGSNQVPCRPDPQPDHGNDCGSNAKVPLNSNDHCGEDIPQ